MDHDETPPLHVAFNTSAAASIGCALHQNESPGRVVGFMDDLSFGPIDPATPRARDSWIAEHFGRDWHDIWQEACREAHDFWTEVTAPAASPVAWVCRNHAGEYAGFLEFVWRMGDRPFRVIDASDLVVPGGTLIRSLGGVRPSQIIDAGLFARQAIVSSTQRDRHHDLWRRLRRENAPLRVVDPGGLVSACIDHFDDAIFACVTPEWSVGARVVGVAMSALVDRPVAQCVGDVVIWSRVLALVDAGRVELEGLRSAMRYCLVRRMP